MLKLNRLLVNNVVLQAEKECVISGTTEPDQTVSIGLGQFSIEEKSDEQGKFLCKLPPQAYGTEETLSVRTSTENQTIAIYYGDVFLFAGQSNMDYRMANEAHFEDEQRAQVPQSIFFTNVPKIEYEDSNKRIPETDEWRPWQQLTKETIGEMSAVAYYAVKTHQERHPGRIIGVVLCSMGGTSASCWISENKLEQHSALKEAILVPYKAAVAGKDDQELLSELLCFWKAAEAHAATKEKWMQKYPEKSIREIKKEVGHSPWPPPANPYLFNRPGGLYQKMFRKIVPFTFSSIIWYQGEEDAAQGDLYHELLQLLIQQWREDLGESVPFYIVQLPIYEDRQEKNWPSIRQAQEQVTKTMRNGYLITSLDCGEVDDIHPIEKSVLGVRIGQLLNKIYYEECPSANVRSWSKKEIVIEIKQARELRLTDVKVIECDQSIEAITLEKNQLIVRPKHPLTSIRYGWSNAFEVALFNEVGYPVSPFYFEKGEL
ncbi:sialate O-acetylesterase [Enterococcus gilvus]|uniref:sialate O-acetylesterase n=1 Tax=Enterococcus gilvus TaxID=160453 RepID=UPI00345E9849